MILFILTHLLPVVLTMQRKYDSYINNMKLGREVQALSALVESFATYDYIYVDAEMYGCVAEVDEIKNQIVNILSTNYGLDENSARALFLTEDNVQYTMALNNVIQTSYALASNTVSE